MLFRSAEKLSVGLSLGIFFSRESLESCLSTLSCAIKAAGKNASIDLLVNGNLQLASEVASHLLNGYSRWSADDLARVRVRVWALPFGDKANAWNFYFHRIWNGGEIAFFIDGYVRLYPESLPSLRRLTVSSTKFLGGSGVPTIGRSANKIRLEMLRSGGFHGNLCCIKGVVVDELRGRGIRIPVGMYRVDSFVGALLCFALNPSTHGWDTGRIAVDEAASWDIDAKRWWRWSDLMATRGRMLRQARGLVENAAVKYFFVSRKLAPEALPTNIFELVDAWAREDPSGFRSFISRNPLSWYSFRQHKRGLPINLSKCEDADLLASMSFGVH